MFYNRYLLTSNACTIIIITEVLKQHYLLIEYFDKGKFDEMEKSVWYRTNSTCTMPPDVARLGWCSQSNCYFNSIQTICMCGKG